MSFRRLNLMPANGRICATNTLLGSWRMKIEQPPQQSSRPAGVLTSVMHVIVEKSEAPDYSPGAPPGGGYWLWLRPNTRRPNSRIEGALVRRKLALPQH